MLNFLLSLRYMRHIMKQKKRIINQDIADITALNALAFIAGDDKYLNLLMVETGFSGGDLAEKPEDPAFLAAILDFILGHEDILINFCENSGIDYTIPALARQQYFPEQVDTF